MSIVRGYRGKFVNIKTSKKRTNSSKQWLMRQLNDQYVIKAKIEGYRSRSAYKLLEINNKFKIFKPKTRVIDLGSAPGGWSQVAAKLTGVDELSKDENQIISIDLLPIEPISGVKFFQGDFCEMETKTQILKMLGENSKADVVMSDMAANTIGHSKTDHLRTINLCEQALEFALQVLTPDGCFIAKIFQGGAVATILNQVKLNFQSVKHFKPKSSRKESSEIYLIAMHRKK